MSETTATIAKKTHVCPRRDEAPFRMAGDPGQDDFDRDDSCSYCGSLNPDTLMARLEAGDVELEPTDKNYKVYVRNQGGASFRHRHRTDSKPFQGWFSPEHDWVMTESEGTKFYFMHLSDDQKRRFVALLNEKKIHIGAPGYFYRLPYFIGRER